MEEEKKCFKDWIAKNTVLALVCALVIGLLVGGLGVYFTNGGTKVASVKGKAITTKDLYNKMKNYYSIDLALEDVDLAILDKKYKLEEDEIKQLEKTAQQYIDMYSQYYGYTEEEFLSNNGFEDKNSFIDYLSVDYKRSVYFYETIEKQLEENAVENYYNENAFGQVNTKHILVQVSENMTDDAAKALADEILGKIKDGNNFDEVANEYTAEYPDVVVFEELGEKGAFDNLDPAYVEEMKSLNKDEYSQEPVKSSFGYHIVYCIDKLEKTENISRKDKMAIIEIIGADKLTEDANAYYKALIEMRKEAGLKFYDKDLQKKYDDYCKQYVTEEDS